jgi:two-component system CitB family response regulator
MTTTGLRTLIVDDDFMVANVHRGYTERVPGFQVVGVAHSGGEALAAVERLRPDLVVLDIYLPDMSGLDVLRELRQRQTPVDVIMVTADRDVASVRAAMQGGALHYIVKPFDFARFREALEAYRRLLERGSGLEAVEQADVDRMYAAMRATPAPTLPKGLNRPTLDLVVKYLGQQPEAASAQDVALGTGVSRGTARRYLEFLELQGRTTLELRYGAAGRPEHRYRLIDPAGAR